MRDGAGNLVDGNGNVDEPGIPGVGDDGEDDTNVTNDEQSEATLDLKTNTVHCNRDPPLISIFHPKKN